MKTFEKNEIDLFENHEMLPIEIQNIFQKYSLLENTYKNCENLFNEIKPYGYEFDYGLDAQPFDLKLSKETKVFELKNNNWTETVFNIESKQICLYNDNLTFKGIGIFTKKQTS